jgi:FkbM family methyltransferase
MTKTEREEIEALTQQLEKLTRRQARNQRAAHANGLMQGICSMLTDKDIVLDCGANVGEVTTVLAATGATVHAFEPDPYAFGKLEKRTAGLPNVVRYNAALGVNSGTIKLMRAANFDDNPKGASVKSTVLSGGRKIDEDEGSAIDVPLISFFDFADDLSREHGQIAFVKMDIEGAELEILEQMHERGFFERIGLTVAETHENKFKDLRPRFKALREKTTEAFPITKVNLDWI